MTITQSRYRFVGFVLNIIRSIMHANVETEIATDCCCGSIGAEKTVRQCAVHHRYWLSDRELTSVSKVIRTVYPTKYDDVDPIVLENARIKGVFIDSYFSEYLSGSILVTPFDFSDMIESHFTRDRFKDRTEHAIDARRRLEMLLGWWDSQNFKAKQVQHTLYSERDGVAGTIDIGTEDDVLDLKVVSSLQPSYGLQLGAYLCLDEPFPLRGAGIIHVMKDKVKLVRYDAKRIKKQWQSALQWFNTMGELR